MIDVPSTVLFETTTGMGPIFDSVGRSLSAIWAATVGRRSGSTPLHRESDSKPETLHRRGHRQKPVHFARHNATAVKKMLLGITAAAILSDSTDPPQGVPTRGWVHWPNCSADDCPLKKHYTWPWLPGTAVNVARVIADTQHTPRMHPQVKAHIRKSQTIIFAVCVKYALANVTMPRWRRYADLHGYDFLAVTSRSTDITGIVAPAWDRVFLAQQLFHKGYRHVMHVDGDTAVLAWETPVIDYIRSSSGPFADASRDAFLYVSQDRGRFGAYLPTKRDFANHISLHSGGQLSGPNNFGVWVMRQSLSTQIALEHLVRYSQTKDRHFQSFPAEQGVLNAWLTQNCSCRWDERNKSSLICRPWSRVFLAPTRPCAYAQAKYGTFQRFLGRGDEPIHIKHRRSEWASALNKTLREYRQSGVFTVHTPSMSSAVDFLRLLFKMVDHLFPIRQIVH